MTEPTLGPVRRVEAKRLLAILLARKESDADAIVAQLATVMVGVPEVVRVAADRLRAWDDAQPQFTMHGTAGGYETVAEVVLDAAAVYRGELAGPEKDADGAEPETLSWDAMIDTLTQVRDYLLNVADGVPCPKDRALVLAAQLYKVQRTLLTCNETPASRDVRA